MHSPIQNKIGAVFVPVSDMARSVDWYSVLLGVEIGETSHDGGIYDVPMQGEVALILDANRPVQTSSQPLFFLWTEDIRAAHAFLVDYGVTLESEVEDVGSVSFLRFHDPDGNPLLICQRNR